MFKDAHRPKVTDFHQSFYFVWWWSTYTQKDFSLLSAWWRVYRVKSFTLAALVYKVVAVEQSSSMQASQVRDQVMSYAQRLAEAFVAGRRQAEAARNNSPVLPRVGRPPSFDGPQPSLAPCTGATCPSGEAHANLPSVEIPRRSSAPGVAMRGSTWFLTIPEEDVDLVVNRITAAARDLDVRRAEIQKVPDCATGGAGKLAIPGMAESTRSYTLYAGRSILPDEGDGETTVTTSSEDDVCPGYMVNLDAQPVVPSFYKHRHAVVHTSMVRTLSWMRAHIGSTVHYEVCRNTVRSRFYLRKNQRVTVMDATGGIGREFPPLPAAYVSSDGQVVEVSKKIAWPKLVEYALDLDTLEEAVNYLRESDPVHFVNSYGRMQSGLAKHFACKTASAQRPIRCGVRQRTPITAEMFDLRRSAKLYNSWTEVQQTQKTLWLWGTSGIGKTKWVECHVENVVRCNDWDGIKSYDPTKHEVLWFDDFDWSLPNANFSIDTLKVLFGTMDEERELRQRYANVRIMAGALRGIVVTANHPPTWYWKKAGVSSVDLKAMERRITVVPIKKRLFYIEPLVSSEHGSPRRCTPRPIFLLIGLSQLPPY